MNRFLAEYPWAESSSLRVNLAVRPVTVPAGEGPRQADRQDSGFSRNGICEIGMTRATGQIYRSFIYMLEQATR